MKRKLLLIVFSFALLFSINASAQIPVVSKAAEKVLPKVTIGIKAGANFQTVTSKTTLDEAYKSGIVGGAFIGLTKGKWGVQIEGLIRSAKFETKADINNPSATLKTINLDVPVLLEYKIIPRIWVQLGPQFSSIISGSTTGTTNKYNYFLKTSDFMGILGLQAILPMHFTVGARYILGLTDINNVPDNAATVKEKWNSRSVQLYVGFRFL